MADHIKTALITGGSKGIGFGIAEVLIKEGVKVAITSRSSVAAELAAAKLNEIKAGYALGLAADVRDLASQERAVATVLAHWHRARLRHCQRGRGPLCAHSGTDA